MNDILHTALARLETEGRLLRYGFKGKTTAPRRVGFAGELLLEPPATEGGPAVNSTSQIMTIALDGAPTIPFFAAAIDTFARLGDLSSVLRGVLKGGGKYFAFCGQVGAASGFQVPLGGALWYVLPRRARTTEGELTKLLYFDEEALEGLDEPARLDALADEGMKYDVTYDMLTFDEGVARWKDGSRQP